MPATIPIKVSGPDANGDLILQHDNGTSAKEITVNVNDTIQWNVDPKSGVEDITGLPPKTGSTDVFDTNDPRRRGTSHNWTGTISPDVGGDVEDYSIIWTDKLGVKNHNYDPKISVNT